jgi:hypothetical protein
LPALPCHVGPPCHATSALPASAGVGDRGCETSITGDGNTAASLGHRRCPAPAPPAKVVRLAPETRGLDFRDLVDLGGDRLGAALMVLSLVVRPKVGEFGPPARPKSPTFAWPA